MVQVEEVQEEPTFSGEFNEWLESIMAGYSGFDDATKKGVAEGMKNVYSKTKHLDTMRIISNGAVDTPDDYRNFFFFPSVADMKHYSNLFASDDIDHQKLKFNASCVFFLAHSKDEKLLRQFVLEGGISAVSKNLEDGNMFARSQHFDILMRMLALKAPGSDDASSLWFPTGPDGKRANPIHDANEAAFFSNLHDALSHEHLLPGLFCMISLKSDCFPDSLVQCLQLFHFTLNWLQFHHTEKDQRLKLPSSWHNLIKELTNFPGDLVIQDAAHQWLNMFDLLPKEDDHCNAWLGIAKQLTPQKVITMPAIDADLCAQQQFATFKGLGNAAFKAKRFDNALPSWQRALEFTKVGKDIAILHSNMSQVHLKQSNWAEASKSAEEATKADEKNFKAFYRWAQAEEKLGNVEMAVTKGKAALNVDPENKEILEFTERVQAIWER